MDAIALVRLAATVIPPDRVLRALEDGALVRTGSRFDEEPEELALTLHEILGDALDDHDDERGVLMIPDVAAPKGRTYDEVVEEIGEGGTWIPLDAADAQGALGGLFASVMGAMQTPEMQRAIGEMRQAASDPSRGDAENASSAQARMMALARSLSGAIAPGQEAAAEAEMKKMFERSGSALGGGDGTPELGGDLGASLEAMMNDPALRKIVEDVGAQLAADPGKMAALQQLLQGENADDDDDDDDDPKLN